MKEIQLTQGKVALVDDDMYEYLNQWKWSYGKSPTGENAYRHTHNGRFYRSNIVMARLIMKAPPDLEVDHIDHNALNNQKYNLRICTHAQNDRNSKIRNDNTSGYKGVSWRPDRKKWRANININMRQLHLGYFDDPKSAAKAYNKAALIHFGEFALLNKL